MKPDQYLVGNNEQKDTKMTESLADLEDSKEARKTGRKESQVREVSNLKAASMAPETASSQ